MPDRPRPARALLPLLALFLLILGARLWLIQTYANATPYWDQWDAEAATLLKPWREGMDHPRPLLGAPRRAPHRLHPAGDPRAHVAQRPVGPPPRDGLQRRPRRRRRRRPRRLPAAGRCGCRRTVAPRAGGPSPCSPSLLPSLFAAALRLGEHPHRLPGPVLLPARLHPRHPRRPRPRPPRVPRLVGGNGLPSLAACFSMGSGFTAAGVVARLAGPCDCWWERRRPAPERLGHRWPCALAVVILGLAIRYDPARPRPAQGRKLRRLAARPRPLPRVAPRRASRPGLVLTWLPWAGLAVAWLRRRPRRDPDAGVRHPWCTGRAPPARHLAARAVRRHGLRPRGEQRTARVPLLRPARPRRAGQRPRPPRG